MQQAGGLSAGARNAQVQYVLTGPDLDRLSQYSDVLLAKMKAIPTVVDADTSLITGKPELRIEIDRTRAADLGVRVSDIAQALNTMVAGEIVSTFNAGTEQYDVRLQAAGDFRSGIAGLSRLTVASKNGPLTLDNVVSIHEGAGPSSIERMNRQRQVTLSSNVAEGGSQAAAIAEMDAEVAKLNLPSGYSSGLAGLSKELGPDRLLFCFGHLTFLHFHVHGVWRRSSSRLIHPVTILLTLPLAIPFGILSLLIMSQTVNIFSGLGTVAVIRHRQKERHSSDRSHQWAAGRWDDSLRRDHAGEPGSATSDIDDDDCSRGWNDSTGPFQRPGCCHQSIDRRSGCWRSDHVPAINASRSAGLLFLL